MELHYIEEDLADHSWYVELVADFVEDVQRFAMQLPVQLPVELEEN